MKLKTLGIWMGFDFKTPLKREGITRFVYYLVKHLIKNYSIKCEIWCYSFNYEEIREIFSDLLGSAVYQNYIVILTEDVFRQRRASRIEIFKKSLESVINILFYGESISWKQPFRIYASYFHVTREDIKARFKRGGRKNANFFVDLFFVALLILMGFAARGIRKVAFKNSNWMHKKSRGKLIDPLAFLANKHSHADIFLIQIVNLHNALDITLPKMLYLPDLVTMEFYELFLESYPNVQSWIDKGISTASAFAQQGVFICSNSDYVRKNHTLKFIKGIKEEKTGFVFLPANIPDDICERIPPKEHIFKKYGVEDNYLFYPTQIRPYKNIIVLLKALEILLRKNISVKLVLTGNIEQIEKLNLFVKEHNLKDHLILTGDVPEADLYALHKYAGATVVPTLFEGGFPWQGLEALLMDTPVVMSRIPVTIERLEFEGIDPQNCGLRLFDPNEPEELAANIAEVLKDRALAVADQKRVKDKLFAYTWDDVSHQYFQLFNNIISRT